MGVMEATGVIRTRKMDKKEAPPTAFVNWLREEMDKRGWKPADLAREADVTDSALSRILSIGDRKPGPDLCNKIAAAFGIEADEVFRLAGLLPEEGGESKGLSKYQEELLSWVDQLDETSQKMILEMAKGLVSRSHLSKRRGRQ